MTQEPIDIAFVDLRLGDELGRDLVARLRSRNDALYIVACSSYLSISQTVDAMRAGANDVVTKPFNVLSVLNAIPGASSELEDSDDTPTLARASWDYITRVLEDCGGNISMAARVLGIYRSALQRRLRKNPPIR